MQRMKEFLRHTGHLWILAVVLVIAGGAGLFARGRFIPPTYGEQPKDVYRAAALTELAARPSRWQTDATCLECHQNVAHEREGSLHEAVSCFHCHGVGEKHVEQARLAAKTPGAKVDAAQKWDGDFLTSIDLFLTKDKRTCLSCHQNAVGMPAEFKKIDESQHLADMGAEKPDSPEVCSECHKGHNTAP